MSVQSRKKWWRLGSLLLLLLFLLSIWVARSPLLSFAGLDDKGLVYATVLQMRGEKGISNLVDHELWTKLLQKYVGDDGMVDYQGFQLEKEALDAYVGMLSDRVPSKSWPVQEQLAYYINTYNANTIALVLKHYPLRSIRDIDGAWTKEIIRIGDTHISLGGLENSILRKMNEPRIHFAINCASISCPKLQNTAFTAQNVDSLLNKATIEFIRSSEKNSIDVGHAHLSKLFKWYTADFDNGHLKDYINQYSLRKLTRNAIIDYKDYNWDLNGNTGLPDTPDSSGVP